ncbi:S8 family serine peptidase [Xanthomonas fragariae]|nr:S8 family serine peptidase [Xanthomonas fragariae]WAT14371.1 S8 family serine peptidase [Xanthomonas fragariae]
MADTALNAKVVPVRVLGRCGGALSDISDAIAWASGGSVNGLSANANPAEVINMSLGGGGTGLATMQNAINSAVSRGTTVMVAAGDSSANVCGAVPANCANVIAVASTTSAGAKASYSNLGAGSAILATLNSGTTTPGTASCLLQRGPACGQGRRAGAVGSSPSAAAAAATVYPSHRHP